ncbi:MULTISPECIES: hypothetical protein [Giesbergeria]|uniref:Uncharacterized protein n=1 Tax=Giesbergeria sinuosa TaxID=80883 RepID=A0ABV9QAZ2_9BURK
MSAPAKDHQENVEQTLMHLHEAIQDVHVYQGDQAQALQRIEAVLLRIEAALTGGKPHPVEVQ